MRTVIAHNQRVQVFSLINLLIGVWLIIVPFAFAEQSRPLATSAVAAGGVGIVSQVIRYVMRHTVALSWLVVIAGAWLIAAPWVFNAHSPGARTWNYVISGIVLAGIATYSITRSAFRHPWGPDDSASAPDEGLSRSDERP